MMKRLTALLLALTMALALAACGSNDTAGNNGGENDAQPPAAGDAGDTGNGAGDELPDEEAPAEITANYDAYTLTAFGDTFQLLPEGVEGIYAATYTSADENVAVVDTEGNVTAAGLGSTTITMHIEGNGAQYDFTCAVTCKWEESATTLNRTDFTLKNVGDTFRLQVMNAPEGAGMGQWTISDEKVATIAEDGTVTAVGGGVATASIELELGGETLTLTCIVRCSAKNGDAPAENTGDTGEAAGVPALSDFYNTLADTYQIGSLSAYEGELLDNYYPGLSAIATKQCLVQETMMTTANAAVSLIEVSDSGDVQAVKDILSARAKAQADGGAWYPASCETWANAVIVSTGNYIGMFVYPENAQAMADLFVSTYGG